MEKKTRLKGITWNHPRGYESIEAVSQAFCGDRPGLEITWHTRSLKDFGDYPVTELAKRYDLIMLDHPHIGSAVKAGALLPLEEWLEPEFLEDQRLNSVGRSFESYQLDGHQWALAVDAAAQVSAYRPDICGEGGIRIPNRWEEVLALAKAKHGQSQGQVGFPLCQTDVYCSFLSICAGRKGDQVFDEAHGPDREAALCAAGVLRELSEYIHPESLEMNPIQMLERMAKSDEIAYIPLVFGYSNYTRVDGEGQKLIRFTNIPSFGATPSGALLGGVGLAVSSWCRNRELAVEFCRFAASGPVQKGIYYEHAGQPGYLGAWKDRAVNESSNGFFADTLDTLAYSYLRPRYEGYNEFQEKAGLVLNTGLKEGKTATEMVDALTELFRELGRNR